VVKTKLIVNRTRGDALCVGELADNPLLRMRGLLGRPGLPAGEGMLITPAPSIHTAFMRFPIDALFLDRGLRVIKIVERLGPWRVASKARARAVLELAAGESARRGVKVGDVLEIRDRRGTAERAGAARGEGSERSSRLAPLRVVLISPDRHYRTAMSLLLARRNCSVRSVPSGRPIGELLAEERCDVVLLDAGASQPAAALAALESLASSVAIVIVADEGTTSVTADSRAADGANAPVAVALLRTVLVLGVAVLAFATQPFDRALVDSVAAGVLVVLAAIDLERRIIPNRVVLPAAAFVLLLNVAIFPSQLGEWMLASVLAAVVFATPALLGRHWVGMGDAKLAMLLGAALGWAVVGAVLVALLLTLPVSGWLFLRDGVDARKATIPFGPFLALGAMLVMFGPALAGVS
jgi:uncharacterized membrane protein (UPF0127 family)/Flp pilus assembly protein protease CpaA